MVVRVAERAQDSLAMDITVATDSERIAAAVQSHGFSAVMTSADHATGTDRLSETAALLQWPDDDIVVNVQGDEPLINPFLIDQVAHALSQSPQASIATAASVMHDQAMTHDPNIVKVVCDADAHALYFSRCAIPFFRQTVPELAPLHHVGIYAYRVSFLKAFPGLTQGLLERAESLEQLRALEHGFKIKVVTVDGPIGRGVDTPADLEFVRQIFT